MVSTPRRTPATRPARDLPRRVRTDKANRTLALEAFPDAVLQSMCPLLLWGRRRSKNQSPLARAMCGTDRPVAQAQIDLSIPARACPLLSRLGLLDINSFPASSRDLCQRARGGALPIVYTEKVTPLHSMFTLCLRSQRSNSSSVQRCSLCSSASESCKCRNTILSTVGDGKRAPRA